MLLIANSIGDGWSDFKLLLDLSEGETEDSNQTDENSNHSNLVLNTLKNWHSRNPSQKRIAILLTRLYQVKYDKVADQLRDILLQAQSDPMLSSYAAKVLQGKY